MPALPVGSSIRRWERLAFWLLLALHLGPLWTCRYFLTCDGPTHLYDAWLLRALLLQPHLVAHKFLVLSSTLAPNYLSHVLLAVGLSLGPPWLAEKLVLTLYVVGLPLALRYALRAHRTHSDWLALLGFPLIYSTVLLWGFYNFCLSLVGLLLVLGYWGRHAGRWRLGTRLGLAALVSLLYLAHPMAYLVAGLVLGLVVLATHRRAARPQPWPQLGVLLIAYLPTLPLLGWYLGQQAPAAAQLAVHYAENLWSWLRLEPIHYFGAAEATYRWLLAGVVAAAIGQAGWLSWRRQLRFGPLAPWALATALLLAAYVFLPDEVAGGSVTRPRWGLLSYLVLLNGLALVPWPLRTRWLGVAASTLVAAALLGFRWQRLEAFEAGLAEYQAVAPLLQPGSTMLPLRYVPAEQLPASLETGTYIPVLAQAVSYLATERRLLSYENYEANANYFPLQWRPGYRPLRYEEALPATLAPVLYVPANVPRYVLLRGYGTAPPTNPASAQQVARYLAQFHFRERYCSPSGWLRLYEQAASR